jgi:hypothetical protein
LRTLDTVLVDTPARLATSRILLTSFVLSFFVRLLVAERENVKKS